jgi:hypothetical protein
MPMVGADLAELSKLVSWLNSQGRQQLTTTLNEMNAAVQDSAAWWVGDYGDKFRQNFSGYVTKTQDSLNQMLAQAARATGQNLSAIATATGNSSGQRNGSSGGQIELTAVSLTADSLTADAPAGNTAGDNGSGIFSNDTREFLEADAAAYAPFFQLDQRATAAFTTVVKTKLWGSPTKLANHVSDHASEFDLNGEDAYARKSFDFLQEAARNGYPAKLEGDTYITYDAKTITFGAYRNDGMVRSVYKLLTNPTKFTDSNGAAAQPGDLKAVAGKAAETVDDSSWLAKAGRLADTPVGRIGGKAFTGLAVAGDLLTIADPSPDALGGPTTERVMAAGNLAAMAVTMAPVADLLAANAALDWVPGVGEVVLAATALYFVGDLVYENRQAIGHALSWLGDGSAHVAARVWDDIF